MARQQVPPVLIVLPVPLPPLRFLFALLCGLSSSLCVNTLAVLVLCVGNCIYLFLFIDGFKTLYILQLEAGAAATMETKRAQTFVLDSSFQELN